MDFIDDDDDDEEEEEEEEEEDIDDLSILEGELWNGFGQLTLGDTTLTTETVEQIIRQRFDRFDVEEVHLSQVTFESPFAFSMFALALRELSSLERLTWHSALTLAQWSSLVDGWDTGQLVELDVEWSVLKPRSDIDRKDNDEGDAEASRTMTQQIFADFVRLTDQKIVLRMEETESEN